MRVSPGDGASENPAVDQGSCVTPAATSLFSTIEYNSHAQQSLNPSYPSRRHCRYHNVYLELVGDIQAATMATTTSKDQKRKDFEAVFPSLVNDLKENAAQYGIPSEALSWYEEVRLQLPIPVCHKPPRLPMLLPPPPSSQECPC